MEHNSAQNRRLRTVFFDILSGKQSPSRFTAPLFLEAITSWPDPAACVEKLIASNKGLVALQQAVRSNSDPAFFNQRVAPVLIYFDSPDLRIINGGTYLHQIVIKIVDPPIFWDAFRKSFLEGRLDERAQLSIAWLLYQLCSLPSELSKAYREHDDTQRILAVLLAPSSPPQIHSMGQRVKNILDTCMSLTSVNATIGHGPGGRHGNDFEDFRMISILPTADELSSTEPSFIRPAYILDDPASESSRVSIHIDNQFRLLREDMLYEMREELQITFGKKKGFHRGVKIFNLRVKELECGPEGKRTRWGLVLECLGGIAILSKEKNTKARRNYLDDHTKFLKHQSVACLISGNEVVSFPTISRDEARLSKDTPELVLQFTEHIDRALYTLTSSSDAYIIQIDTAIFSYEPILKRLQAFTTLPLASEILLWKRGDPVGRVRSRAEQVISALSADHGTDLRPLLGTSSSTKLDNSQAVSLITGLTQECTDLIIGTGKSFIGALLAKALYQYTKQTILVVCYTNHALDDILEGLLNIGIPESAMLRLGGKSSTATEPLTLQNQGRVGNRTRDQWTIIDTLKTRAEELHGRLQDTLTKCKPRQINFRDIAEHIQYSDPASAEALHVPFTEDQDGMKLVDQKGRPIGPHYLMQRWRWGSDAGVFVNEMTDSDLAAVWKMPLKERKAKWKQWEEEIRQEDIKQFAELAQDYNKVQDELARAFNSNMLPLLRRKRVVGCTTTAAAKYCEDIQAFNPDVLLVEEAGEILESHILTSMGPETSQLILIGDHKQLRPKVNNYALTVEKGEGYDLNRSMFERLILKDYPHETLSKQHRMRPEISSLIRELTYPELVDADSTLTHPDVFGLQDNIILIHHEKPEGDDANIVDRRDPTATASKHNHFEVEMILKIVKYLGQQGYGTDDLVVLTPYLGQLHKLRHALKKDNDPVLNDLDSYDLLRAGLINQADAKLTKKPIRLATIDNYQGEECDIVVVSLTRSNPQCEIGFMVSPERLNVMLSRARNGLIMIGNMDTFRGSRRGKELWTRLFNKLSSGKHIYEGLPAVCVRHPDKTPLLRSPEDFDLHCPDGGCSAPCGVMLSCNMHACPSKCHQVSDHSKMKCEVVVQARCFNGHSQPYKCGDGPALTCAKCEREARLARERQEEELRETQRRETEQREHLRRIDEIDKQITAARQQQEDKRSAKDRANALLQKQQDLQAILSTQPPGQPALHPTNPNSNSPQMFDTALPFAPPDATTRTVPPTTPKEKVAEATTKGVRRSAKVAGQDTMTSDVNPPPASFTSRPSSKPFPTLPPSLSKMEWERQKALLGVTNPAVDAIMDMTGLEGVKVQVLEVMDKIDTTKRQGASLKQERFNATLLGNPGTGKTTVARHYAQFLASVKVTPGSTFHETTGARLAHDGVDGAKKLLENVIKSGGGTIFVDEAYQLTSGHSYQGPAVLDFLLAEMENNVGTLVFLLAGYNKEMEKFFEHNPGLKSRVPLQLDFADYKDEELMEIFQSIVTKTFNGRMKVEDGTRGLYSRILIRRLGRRRGQPGFGNARDLQGTFARVRGRQSTRLAKARKNGIVVDDCFMTGEDLIGPDPSKVIVDSKAWKKLQGLIGLQSVKDSVQSLFGTIEENYQRELMEKRPIEVSLNRVFLGSPGTGKTTVAKLYGQILADLELLSNGEVLAKDPADFTGAHLGQSEEKTKGILANALGKVLIIDEAYMLYGGGGGGSDGNNNPYKTSVIDTIVAEVQNVPGEDRCVLMLGYKEQMLEMFRSSGITVQNVNPGLSRRFKIEDAFNFEDFDDAQLLQILEYKLHDQDLDATPHAKRVAIEVLSRMRNRPNFGNAGEVENIITAGKSRCVTRRARLPTSEKGPDIVFEPEDFDPDYNRTENASTNLVALFEDIVGHEDIIHRLSNYQEIARTCKARDLDLREHIPTNFVFTGPPGTGKTTVARKMGKVFYDMGLLASAEVIECSASDLVASFVGQTGPKTRQLFEKAVGKVLFIDEAYQLGDGAFAQEAVDELVRLLTLPNYKSKLIVILAGYEKDINALMTVNSGLSSRFPDQVYFKDMDADYCLKVVNKELEKGNVLVEGLGDESSDIYHDLREVIRDMSELNDWGNARDMKTLSKELVNRALLSGGNGTSSSLGLSGEDALKVAKKILADRQRRAKVAPNPRRHQAILQAQSATAKPPPAPTISMSTNATERQESPPPVAEAPRASTPESMASSRGRGQGRGGGHGGRGGAVPTVSHAAPVPTKKDSSLTADPTVADPGVTVDIWEQLHAAMSAQDEQERKMMNEIRLRQQEEANVRGKEQAERKLVEDLVRAEIMEKNAARKAELQRLREEARLREHAARVAKEKVTQELLERQEAERRRKEQEAKAQHQVYMRVSSRRFGTKTFMRPLSTLKVVVTGYVAVSSQLGRRELDWY
ncbi:P-loop containing nucleoside triphosphate hydrolase protein [Cristinia sonorae]|uniref:P-loop containing nucleoside triphosphate hydrolase protein n=1 Tax=Cristinia sonorae TaxID=1940300 RepID=A0A8K0UV61_9AGAR|nr:P-loop containing nucleoside triphosphate hydrolase protein [Cristinia sonorae]